jgi:trans-aconitate methyltransferase
MGCGAGAGTHDLAAALPAAATTAFDTHADFLAALRRRVGPSVGVLEADMAGPPIPAGSLDLIWCESAIYSVGRTVALTAWRALLATGGLVASSDVVWTTDDPPAAARAFWAAEYPAMTTPVAIEAEIAAAGFRAMARHAAPRSHWLDYYAPLRERLDRLADGADPTLATILDGMRREIAVFDDHSDSYASVWFVLRVDG